MAEDPPQIVALIGSPYQALNLIEYVETMGVESGLVFICRRHDAELMAQVFNTLSHLRGFRFRFRELGGFGKPKENTGRVSAELAAIASAEVPGATLVLGDYRETLGWRLGRDLGCEGDRFVVLDDGAGTMHIDRSAGGVQPLEWSAEAEDGGFLPLPSVTFFTAFADLMRPSPTDVVIRHKYSWLASRYQHLPRSKSVVLVIGQPFGPKRMVDAAQELEIAAHLVAQARDLFPEASPLYVAHRVEPVEKLHAISEYCDVVKFDLAVELVPIDGGVLPAGVVGHYSAALTSLADLSAGRFPVYSVRLPLEDFGDWGEYIAQVYDQFASGYSESITIID